MYSWRKRRTQCENKAHLFKKKWWIGGWMRFFYLAQPVRVQLLFPCETSSCYPQHKDVCIWVLRVLNVHLLHGRFFPPPLHCATCEITVTGVFLNSSPTKCDPLERGVGEEADSVRPPQLSLRRSYSTDLLSERILERLLWCPAARKHTRMKIWRRKQPNYQIFRLSATAERIFWKLRGENLW